MGIITIVALTLSGCAPILVAGGLAGGYFGVKHFKDEQANSNQAKE